MQKANNMTYNGVQLLHIAQRLSELQTEKGDAEQILREIKADIADMEALLSDAMEQHRDWLGVLVGVFKKQGASVVRKGGVAGV